MADASQEHPKSILYRGKAYGEGLPLSMEDYKKARESGEQVGGTNLSSTPQGQPVSQPGAPGVGIPSGLKDARPVLASGALGSGSVADALGTDDEDEDEDEDEEESYEDMTKSQLVALCEERGLEVVRSEGEGAPLKEDYIAALEADDEDSDEEDEEDEDSEDDNPE